MAANLVCHCPTVCQTFPDSSSEQLLPKRVGLDGNHEHDLETHLGDAFVFGTSLIQFLVGGFQIGQTSHSPIQQVLQERDNVAMPHTSSPAPPDCPSRSISSNPTVSSLRPKTFCPRVSTTKRNKLLCNVPLTLSFSKVSPDLPHSLGEWHACALKRATVSYPSSGSFLDTGSSAK